MKLYYKSYLEDAVEIPENALICNDSDLESIRILVDYPIPYCWEVDIINRMQANEEGYFDFSKNMIDIGAGLGEYSWLLPFKHAYAFEPNKETLYRLHTNLVMHDKVYDCDTFNEFCSDVVEDVNYNGWNTANIDLVENYESHNIKTTTIDSHCFNNIGFIKVDVEGYEEKALRGAIGTIIRNNYPPILFESFDVGLYGQTKEHRDSLFNFLKSLGYTILEYWGDFETHLAIHE